MASFGAQVHQFSLLTQGKMNLIVRKLALDAFRGLIVRSPVDTGRFRGNWHVGLNQPDLRSKAPPESAPRKRAQPTSDEMLEGLKTIAQANRYTEVWITNNLPYAVPLERGHSKQAPHGVLAPTFTEIEAKFDRLVQALKHAIDYDDSKLGPGADQYG